MLRISTVFIFFPILLETPLSLIESIHNKLKIIIIVFILSLLLFFLYNNMFSIVLTFSILEVYFIHPWFNNILDHMVLDVGWLYL